MTLPARCEGCNGEGIVRGKTKPRWCKCKGAYGPLVAPAKHVSVFLFAVPPIGDVAKLAPVTFTARKRPQ